MPEAAASSSRRASLWQATLAASGLVVFALFSHRGALWIGAQMLGLLVTASAIERSMAASTGMAELFGFSGYSRRLLPLSLAGAGLGVGLAMLARWDRDLPVLPNSLQPFVILACLIGAAEEVVYRGWLQGRIAVLGPVAAVVLAALAHAAYKTALFAWPAEPMAFDLGSMACWTAAGGCIIGALRAFSRSVVPSIAAHVAFDLLLYGAFVSVPWWVWG